MTAIFDQPFTLGEFIGLALLIFGTIVFILHNLTGWHECISARVACVIGVIVLILIGTGIHLNIRKNDKKVVDALFNGKIVFNRVTNKSYSGQEREELYRKYAKELHEAELKANSDQ
jgi:hypothetical protein